MDKLLEHPSFAVEFAAVRGGLRLHAVLPQRVASTSLWVLHRDGPGDHSGAERGANALSQPRKPLVDFFENKLLDVSLLQSV
jgi:hypothetical protein